MSKQILTTLAFMMLTVFTFAQKNSGLSSTTSSTQLASDAKAFGLSIMKAYFDHNYVFVHSKLNTEIMILEDGRKVKKSEITQQDIKNMNELRDDIPVSYSLYLQNFAPEVLNAKQFAAKYPTWQAHLQLKDGDFFFDGAVMKSGGTDMFMGYDIIRFVLRSTGSKQFLIMAW